MSGFIYVSGPLLVRQGVIPTGDTVATFIGDPVTTGATADTVDYLPTIAVAAAGANVRGVVQSFEPDRLYENQKHRTASTKRLVNYIMALPGTQFKVKSDAAMLVSEVGLLFDYQSGAGSASTGHSGYILDNSGTGATTSAQCRFLGVLRDTDNMNINATPSFTDKDASTTNVWCLIEFVETQVAVGGVGT